MSISSQTREAGETAARNQMFYTEEISKNMTTGSQMQMQVTTKKQVCSLCLKRPHKMELIPLVHLLASEGWPLSLRGSESWLFKYKKISGSFLLSDVELHY